MNIYKITDLSDTKDYFDMMKENGYPICFS